MIQPKNRVKAKKINKPKPKPKKKITFDSVSLTAILIIGFSFILFVIVEKVWHYFKHHFK